MFIVAICMIGSARGTPACSQVANPNPRFPIELRPLSFFLWTVVFENARAIRQLQLSLYVVPRPYYPPTHQTKPCNLSAKQKYLLPGCWF